MLRATYRIAMRSRPHYACLPAAIALIGLPRPAMPQNSDAPKPAPQTTPAPPKARLPMIFLAGNTTIDHAIQGDVVVGYANQSDFAASARGTSPVVRVMNGGSVSGNLYAKSGSKMTISGGSVGGQVIAFDNSTVTISGGHIAKNIGAGYTSTLTLIGTGLSKTLVSTDSAKGLFSVYTLTGKLSDGASLEGKIIFVQNGSHPKITLINSAASH